MIRSSLVTVIVIDSSGCIRVLQRSRTNRLYGDTRNEVYYRNRLTVTEDERPIMFHLEAGGPGS